ncbi:MAG: endolytic transglycosylase MltG [Anaerolineaceae bacterium]|nr:endolytic transglycosylase MltG [Anaerolineaceae bacterium]
MKKRNSCLNIFLITGFVLICLLLIGISIVLYSLPERASSDFGLPGNELSLFQKYTYPIKFYLNKNELITPVNPAMGEINFNIVQGEEINSIIYRLEADGFIRNPVLFREYLIYSGLDRKIQAGEYSLDHALSPMDLARVFQDSTPKEIQFGILPGWRIEEIAASLPTSGLSISSQEFLFEAVQMGNPNARDNKVLGLEGYLQPGSYTIDRDASKTEFISLLLGRFEENLTEEMMKGFERQGLSLHEAVILASIVDKEAIIQGEQTMIASVFMNRLEMGMKLESDPTVQYAVGYFETDNTWWKNPITYEDLNYDSSFNTYIYTGLPPGPICSPTTSALQAVAFPAESPYLFFRADCDGSGRHLFAKTYEEHLNNACK